MVMRLVCSRGGSKETPGEGGIELTPEVKLGGRVFPLVYSVPNNLALIRIFATRGIGSIWRASRGMSGADAD